MRSREVSTSTYHYNAPRRTANSYVCELSSICDRCAYLFAGFRSVLFLRVSSRLFYCVSCKSKCITYRWFCHQMLWFIQRIGSMKKLTGKILPPPVLYWHLNNVLGCYFLLLFIPLNMDDIWKLYGKHIITVYRILPLLICFHYFCCSKALTVVLISFLFCFHAPKEQFLIKVAFTDKLQH